MPQESTKIKRLSTSINEIEVKLKKALSENELSKLESNLATLSREAKAKSLQIQIMKIKEQVIGKRIEFLSVKVNTCDNLNALQELSAASRKVFQSITEANFSDGKQARLSNLSKMLNTKIIEKEKQIMEELKKTVDQQEITKTAGLQTENDVTEKNEEYIVLEGDDAEKFKGLVDALGADDELTEENKGLLFRARNRFPEIIARRKAIEDVEAKLGWNQHQSTSTTSTAASSTSPLAKDTLSTVNRRLVMFKEMVAQRTDDNINDELLESTRNHGSSTVSSLSTSSTSVLVIPGKQKGTMIRVDHDRLQELNKFDELLKEMEAKKENFKTKRKSYKELHKNYKEDNISNTSPYEEKITNYKSAWTEAKILTSTLRKLYNKYITEDSTMTRADFNGEVKDAVEAARPELKNHRETGPGAQFFYEALRTLLVYVGYPVSAIYQGTFFPSGRLQTDSEVLLDKFDKEASKAPAM